MEEMMVRLFGSTARPRILSLFVSRPDQTFYQREIMYETGLSLQAVQRELENLIRLGILKRRETKVRVYYQIDVTSPWFRPLKEICELGGKDLAFKKCFLRHPMSYQNLLQRKWTESSD